MSKNNHRKNWPPSRDLPLPNLGIDLRRRRRAEHAFEALGTTVQLGPSTATVIAGVCPGPGVACGR